MRNKLLYLITSFLFLSVFTMSAQDHKYGFRMGLNYSDIDFDDDSTIVSGGSDARYGFMAGFFAIYSFSETFSIQPEIQYSAQGEKSSSTFDSTGLEGQFSEDPLRINLLQVPILLNYTIANRFTISAGPQIGLRIWEWERSDDYETVQFSAIGSIGYNITDNWTLNLRASYGLTDAIDADNTNSFEVQNPELNAPIFKAKGANHFVQFSVAYSL